MTVRLIVCIHETIGAFSHPAQSVTVLLINLDNATAVRVASPFASSAASASTQRRFVLTSGAAADPMSSVNDLLVSRRVRVNGALLQVRACADAQLATTTPP